MNGEGTSDRSASGRMRVGEWLAFTAVMALALAMRLYRIGSESIWFDECITYLGLHYGNPLEFFRHEATHDPSSVPFYYGSAWVWYRLGFTSIVAMRMLSVIAGMAVVAGVYGFGRRLFGHIGGLTAALCVACVKLHVYEAQEVRNYTFTLAVALFAMFALYKAAVEDDARWWPINVAANVLLAYTHLLGTMLLFGEGVYLLLARPREIKRTALWTLAHAPFLAMIPLWIRLITTANFDRETNWIPRSFKQRAFDAYFYVFAGSKMDAPDLVRALPLGWVPIPKLLGCAMLIAGAAFASYCGWAWWRKADRVLPGYRPRQAVFLFVWLFAPPAALYLVGKVQPCFLERYVLYSSLALYLCVGGAVAALPWRAAQYAGFAALALLFAGNTVDLQRPLRYDTASAGKVLRDEYAPGERVYSWFDNTQLPVRFYGGVPEDHFIGGEDFAEKAAVDAETAGRAWILFHEVPGRFEHGDVEETIAKHPVIASTKWSYSGRWTMYLYKLESANAPQDRSAP